MKYPKINSLWKRQGWFLEGDKKKDPQYQAGRQSFIVGDYAVPEFGNIRIWHVQEKIDGTNIRVEYKLERDGPRNTVLTLEYKGRTDEAMIPVSLHRYLHNAFPASVLQNTFQLGEEEQKIEVTLFGEGYGPKIQAGGGNYREDQGFILFDVVVDGWWLKQEDVEKIAARLNVPYAPFIGYMTEEQIVAYVKSKPMSLCSKTPQVMEGIIARPAQLLLLRDGSPLLMKLKCKEF